MAAGVGGGHPELGAEILDILENERQRDLSGKHYVYIWGDGIHFNVRQDDERSCIMVMIGATREGKKELLAVMIAQGICPPTSHGSSKPRCGLRLCCRSELPLRISVVFSVC